MCTAVAADLGELDSIHEVIASAAVAHAGTDDLAEARAARLSKAQRYGVLRPV